MMDYLAEVTMSIMQKQKSRDPNAGYARDFVPLMERILPDIVEQRIRVTSNAGGVNPRGCAEAVLEVARRLGLQGKLTVGLVTGDDILGRLDELIARGSPAQRHGDRPAARRHPRPGALAPTPTSAWRRSSRRCAAAPTSWSPAGSPTPGSRWARSSTSSAGRPTTGTRSPPAPSPATSSSAARRLRRQPAQGLAVGEGTGRTRASPSSRRRPTAASSSPSTPAPAASSRCASVTEQLVYEMGDPHELHHARRRRRLHHHPAPPGRARTGCG